MAEMRGSTSSSWARDAKSKAKELRHSAEAAAQTLFYDHDLRGILTLICRLHHLDAYNLLLIWQQYPKATCLTSFKQWQALFEDPYAQVLKPEWRGKGIDLIAPFTQPIGNRSYALTWHAIKQFDISQTNLKNYCPTPPVYISDSNHLQLLQNSLIHVAATEYHHSVIPIPSSAQLSSTSLAGQMNEATILLRSDIKPSHRIQFLCECLCKQAIGPDVPFTPSQIDLMTQYIIYCLFLIWSLEPVKQLRQPISVLSSVSQERQIDFISILQRTVRTIDESVSAVYLHSRGGERCE